MPEVPSNHTDPSTSSWWASSPLWVRFFLAVCILSTGLEVFTVLICGVKMIWVLLQKSLRASLSMQSLPQTIRKRECICLCWLEGS